MIQEVANSDNNNVLWIAVVTGIVTFLGTLVTGFVTWSGQQNASRERIAAALEARDLGSKVIKTVEEGNATIGEVAHSVNSAASEMREELKQSNKATATAVLALAEMTKKYDLMVSDAVKAAQANAPSAPENPVDVKIVDQTKPIDAKIIKH